MSKLTGHYEPPSSRNWHGRADSHPQERLYQHVQCLDLNHESLPSGAQGLVIVGFCCDAGVARNLGRRGAAEGPDALRHQFGNLATLASVPAVFDVGNIVCHHDELEAAQTTLGAMVATIRLSGHIPVVLGGGHETAWGHYLGLAETVGKDFGIINVDAHFDLRPLQHGAGHSGSPFLQIAEHRLAAELPFNYLCLGIQPQANTQSVWQTANNLNVITVLAESIHQDGMSELIPIITEYTDMLETIYLTLCLDAFASPYAPGVSAPQVFGILPWHGQQIIRHILATKKVVAIDIVEYAPKYDQDQRTAQLAAGLMAEIVNG
jgi:formiminoglutamase